MVNCETYVIEKKITCTIPAKCSDKLRVKLEEEFNCKLMARIQTDSVHGAISIDHTPNKHVIRIDFYTKTEKPNDEHKTTLSKLSLMPSEKQCKECLS